MGKKKVSSKNKSKKRMTAVEILTKARKLLEKSWIRGHYREVDDAGESRYCAIGALGVAAGINPYDFTNPVLDSARRAIESTIGVGSRTLSIQQWNDNIVSGKDEVLSTFDRTIARLKKKREYDRAYRRGRRGLPAR